MFGTGEGLLMMLMMLLVVRSPLLLHEAVWIVLGHFARVDCVRACWILATVCVAVECAVKIVREVVLASAYYVAFVFFSHLSLTNTKHKITYRIVYLEKEPKPLFLILRIIVL
jgi:hypothetical protein